MNYNDTIVTLSNFYRECAAHWERESGTLEDAIKDVERLEYDPFSPFGKKLNEEAKRDFIKFLHTL